MTKKSISKKPKKTKKTFSKEKKSTVFCEVCGIDAYFASRYKIGQAICVDCRSLQLLRNIQWVIEECNFLKAKILDVKWQFKQLEIDLRKNADV